MSSGKTQRIARNTLLLYGRSLLCLFISIFSSRFVLQALGETDMGIYNAVGGFVSMFWVVSRSTSAAIGRFINYELGAGDSECLGKVFSTSLCIMFVVSVLVVAAGETFGLWFLNGRLNIPPERMHVARAVFQISLLSSVSDVLTAPYTAVITAHEKMDYVAILAVTTVMLKLFIALFLAFGECPFDRLLTYAALWLAVVLATQQVSRIFARRHFPECRFKLSVDKGTLRSLSTFIGWNFLTDLTSTFSGQGVNMALNIAYGPAVNAARGLSNTVTQSVNIFANNFTTAVNPQITQSYASGDRTYMNLLLDMGTRITSFLMFVVVFPLFLEADFIINLWLADVPAHTVNFVRISLVSCLISSFCTIIPMGIRATGKIKSYQLGMSVLQIAQFFLSIALLRGGAKPESVYYIALLMYACSWIFVAALSHVQFGASVRQLLRVYGRIILVEAAVAAAVLPVHHGMQAGWPRCILTAGLSVLCTGLAAYCIAFNKEERGRAVEFVRNMIR